MGKSGESSKPSKKDCAALTHLDKAMLIRDPVRTHGRTNKKKTELVWGDSNSSCNQLDNSVDSDLEALSVFLVKKSPVLKQMKQAQNRSRYCLHFFLNDVYNCFCHLYFSFENRVHSVSRVHQVRGWGLPDFSKSPVILEFNPM